MLKSLKKASNLKISKNYELSNLANFPKIESHLISENREMLQIITQLEKIIEEKETANERILRKFQNEQLSKNELSTFLQKLNRQIEVTFSWEEEITKNSVCENTKLIIIKLEQFKSELAEKMSKFTENDETNQRLLGKVSELEFLKNSLIEKNVFCERKIEELKFEKKSRQDFLREKLKSLLEFRHFFDKISEIVLFNEKDLKVKSEIIGNFKIITRVFEDDKIGSKMESVKMVKIINELVDYFEGKIKKNQILKIESGESKKESESKSSKNGENEPQNELRCFYFEKLARVLYKSELSKNEVDQLFNSIAEIMSLANQNRNIWEFSNNGKQIPNRFMIENEGKKSEMGISVEFLRNEEVVQLISKNILDKISDLNFSFENLLDSLERKMIQKKEERKNAILMKTNGNENNFETIVFEDTIGNLGNLKIKGSNFSSNLPFKDKKKMEKKVLNLNENQKKSDIVFYFHKSNDEQIASFLTD